MNQNYTEFKFPQIKPHPWQKVFRGRTPTEAMDLVSQMLAYAPDRRITAIQVRVFVVGIFPARQNRRGRSAHAAWRVVLCASGCVRCVRMVDLSGGCLTNAFLPPSAPGLRARVLRRATRPREPPAEWRCAAAAVRFYRRRASDGCATEPHFDPRACSHCNQLASGGRYCECGTLFIVVVVLVVVAPRILWLRQEVWQWWRRRGRRRRRDYVKLEP